MTNYTDITTNNILFENNIGKLRYPKREREHYVSQILKIEEIETIKRQN